MRIAALIVCLGAMACAEDFQLADGRILKDVVVTREGEGYLQVRHAGGACRLYAKELSFDLQKRFNMTPDHLARREEARAKASREAWIRRREERESSRAAMEAAGKQPRYLSAEDVMLLSIARGGVSRQEAEYMAFEWNRREAARLELEIEAAAFAQKARDAQGRFELAQRAFEKEKRDAAEEQRQTEALKQKLDGARNEIRLLKQEVESWKRRADSAVATTTVVPAVVSRPVYVPVRYPVPVRPLPPARPPLPPPGGGSRRPVRIEKSL